MDLFAVGRDGLVDSAKVKWPKLAKDHVCAKWPSLHTKLAITSIGRILTLAVYCPRRLPWTQGAAAPEPTILSGGGVMKLSEAAKSWLVYHRVHS